jgi:beta-phosphoglucomutase
MTAIKGLLFDLDGVIVDTAKYHYVAWKALADKLNVPFSHEENEQLKGVGRADSLAKILIWGNIDIAEHEKKILLNEKNEHYKSLISKMEPSEILPGVMEFLNAAKAAGYKMAIGSSSKNAPAILKAIGLYDFFDAIIDGNKISHSKPHPEVFEKGAKALHLSNEECVVFEDAIAGVESAKNAGMKCIGVGEANVLTEADRIIPGFENAQLNILEF